MDNFSVLSLLFSSYLVNRMFALVVAEFFQLQLGRAFGHTDTCSIVPVLALFALKPDILPFALLFRHKNRPLRTSLLTEYRLPIPRGQKAA